MMLSFPLFHSGVAFPREHSGCLPWLKDLSQTLYGLAPRSDIPVKL